MKYLVLFLIGFYSITASAQTLGGGGNDTTPLRRTDLAQPRFGTGVYTDNTYRVLTSKLISVVSPPNDDTVKLKLNAYKTIISVLNIAAGDTLAILFADNSACHLGDEAIITFINPGLGNRVVYFPPGMALTTNQELDVINRTNIAFIFDGLIWTEVSRMYHQ